MKYLKKSLGQNFLIEKNIIHKILNLVSLEDKNILEIGAGHGALTDEIIKKKPKSLTLIEKDFEFSKLLNEKYKKSEVKIINSDILKFNLDKINSNKLIIFGNLPYNISSQILIKFLKYKNFEKKFDKIIFMFQKEVGEKIISKFPSKNYGRLSIISNFKLQVKSNFLVSANCFFPKPKVKSMVIYFETIKKKKLYIKDISNLEKVTNILFSNKRKMINKKIKEILCNKKLKKIPELNLNLRPEQISPEIYYKITQLFEQY